EDERADPEGRGGRRGRGERGKGRETVAHDVIGEHEAAVAQRLDAAGERRPVETRRRDVRLHAEAESPHSWPTTCTVARGRYVMPSIKQRTAARKNITKAGGAAKRKRTIAHLPKKTRTALGKQANKVKREKRG